jgi:hypothetical protein
MSSQQKPIEELVRELPADLQQEVRDFIEFLMEKRSRKLQQPFKLDWRGALRDLRDEFSSVDLQHKSLDWWEG